MKLIEKKIVATVATADIGFKRPFPNDAALDTASDNISDAIEMGLNAVLENLKNRFPNIIFTIE
jgi:hypothetical protein